MKQLGIFFIFFFIVMISRAQTVVQDDVLQYEKEMLETSRKGKDSVLIVIPDTVVSDIVYSDTLEINKDSLPFVNILDVENKKTIVQEVVPLSVRKFYRTLHRFRRSYRDMLERWDDIFIPEAPASVRTDADYFMLAMPATYYSASYEEATSIKGWKPVIPFIKERGIQDTLEIPRMFTRSNEIARAVRKQLLSFYIQYPNLVKKNESALKDIEPLPQEMRKHKPRKENVLLLLPTYDSLKYVKGHNDIVMFKPNFWKVSGNASLQFSQNHISENWYKGGESTNSLLSTMLWHFNYDNRQKFIFENTLEWKLGFVTAPSDTVHKYKTNNDLIRFYSKIGYNAIWNWYYTCSAEFKTQFFSTFDTNSDHVVSTFLSPCELNVGVGLTYKYDKGKFKINVDIKPANATRYGVADKRIDPTRFNVEAGKKYRWNKGSRIDMNGSWTVINNLVWEYRAFYNTDYKRAEAEWENRFRFSFNRYFTSELYMLTRFDDAAQRVEGKSFFQFIETFTLGFNYSW